MSGEIPVLNLKQQYHSIKNEINDAINSVLESGRFILGENVQEFEKEFARYCNMKFAIGVGSGTDALHLSLCSFNIGHGDEVITTSLSAIATSFSITYTGAKPVFVDIDPETYNIDTKKVEEKITDKTKAIIPVHLYGHSTDLDPLLKIAEKHNLLLIEDASQSHGALYKGKKVGSFGDVATFSFYPTKNLGCYGDGGIVLTNNKQTYEKILLLREYGQEKRYNHSTLGFNSRLDEIQAAILRVKLKKLDGWNNLRRKNANLYNELLENSDVITPIEKEYANHVYHLYVIRSKKRDELRQWLKSRGVLTDIHYPTPIHLQKAYKSLNYKKGSLPVVEKHVNQILTLPMFPELKEEQITRIASLIKTFRC
jgi:dTDP-4-amino-4,6-dideoxygalactose transaminase